VREISEQIARAIVARDAEEVERLCRYVLVVKVPSTQRRFNRHPLGFYQLKLGREQHGHVKIHVWPPDEREIQNPPWEIHRHRWDVSSMVLRGELVNEVYRVVEVQLEGGEATNALYSVSFKQNESRLVRRREIVSCTLMNETRVRRGEFYFVSVSDFHRSRVPVGQLTATAIVTPEVVEDSPTVVGGLDGQAEYRYERSFVSDERQAELLSLVT
jgi:hypothetical protein